MLPVMLESMLRSKCYSSESQMLEPSEAEGQRLRQCTIFQGAVGEEGPRGDPPSRGRAKYPRGAC